MSKFEDKIQICPLESSLELINKKWTILIVRDLFFGKKHFSEFKKNNPKLSNEALSRCLIQMENDNLIKKNITDNNTSYELTDNGLKFKDDDKTAIEKIYKEKLGIE